MLTYAAGGLPAKRSRGRSAGANLEGGCAAWRLVASELVTGACEFVSAVDTAACEFVSAADIAAPSGIIWPSEFKENLRSTFFGFSNDFTSLEINDSRSCALFS